MIFDISLGTSLALILGLYRIFSPPNLFNDTLQGYPSIFW